MKSHQAVLIACIATVIWSVMCGCAIFGQTGDKSVTGFEYPEVPEDYPHSVFWKRSEAERAHILPDQLEEQELLSMVMVKLWSEGNHDFTGGVLSNGTFYPLYPDVAYVEWAEYEKPDGTIHKRISDVIATNRKIMEEIRNGETPPGIKIVDIAEAGVDVNEFLSK